MSRHRMTKVQEKFLLAFAPIVSEIFETYISWEEINVYPSTGYWTTAHADVQQFIGDFKAHGVSYSLGSWNTLTDCGLYGFEVQDERGNPRADANFVIAAKRTRTKFKCHQKSTPPS